MSLRQEELIQELGGISDARARRDLLRGHPDLLAPGVVERLYDDVVKLARKDLQRAGRLAQVATWISETIDDDYCRAQGKRATGHVLLIRGKYTKALSCYNAALSLFRRLGKEVEVGRTLYGGSLQALIYLGLYDQAFAWAMEAREIFLQHGDRLRLARLDSNLGNVLYRQDRFEEALEHYQRALREFQSNGEPQDIAITLRNIAVCYISLAEFECALDTYRNARDHCERNHLPLLVAEADYNIAYLYYQRGDYTRAAELYQATREHCERLGDPYHEALCDLDQSEMYLEVNLDEEGAHLAQKAAASFQDLGMKYEQGKALAFLAVALSRGSKVSRALELFKKARRLFVREHNEVWTALIDLYQALVLYKNGMCEESQRLCHAALQFFSTSSLPSKAILCELLHARLLLQAGEAHEAHRVCTSALARLDRAEAPVIRSHAYFVLGTILESLEDRAAALQAYKEAHALLENLRSRLKREELKIAFLKDKLAVYESLVWMCLGENPTASHKRLAFRYVEQAKSRSLADLIAFRAFDLREHADGAEGRAAKARNLREELNWYYREIERAEIEREAQPPGRIETLHRGKKKREDELVRALTRLHEEDEDFGILRNAGTIDQSAIQRSIPEDSVLLEYYKAREVLYACVLDRRSLEFVRLGPVSQVRNLLRLLQFQLSKLRLGPEYVARFGRPLRQATEMHLNELYRVLIAPVRHLMRGKHIIVVPHDILHYLPFQALYDGRNFLIDDFSISYAPSSSVYYHCSSKPVTSENRSLVLGIPDNLAPYILAEVRDVASELPQARLLVGDQATEQNLRAYGPGCRYMHIATHGLFRHDNPVFSSMTLGDSQLNLLDLYSLELSTELVTLSGCSTGLNAVLGGDELLGLVRGLLYAGSRAVLVTLWDVDDRSTAEFMRLFYRNLKGAANKAVALQRAVKELRDIYPHPYYWAPFVLIGKRD